MEAPAVPLICYFGGTLSSATNSADYIGGSSTATFITRTITVSELHHKAKVTCGISEDAIVKLKCRYPLNQSQSIAVDICDESSLAVAMASIPTLSNSVVMYVEEISQQYYAPLNLSTVEGVDKHATLVSPSESRVPRTPPKIKRGRDIGWLHCRSLGESTNKTQCNYCGKVMSGGGITRMKQHLAGGNDVEKCMKCGPEVRQIFRDLIRKRKQSKSSKRLIQQREEEVGLLLDSFEKEVPKEVSPINHCQISAGASSGRTHEEMALVDADSYDFTGEGADKQVTITSPPELRVPSTPLKAGRGRDIGWLHCKPIGEGTNKTECNYCGKVMFGGGITRMKQHLAGGSDVEECSKCGPEVRQMFRDLFRKKQFKSGKRLKEQRYTEVNDNELLECFDNEAVKEVPPVVQSQLLAGEASGRAHEEIAFMNGDSDE